MFCVQNYAQCVLYMYMYIPLTRLNVLYNPTLCCHQPGPDVEGRPAPDRGHGVQDRPPGRQLDHQRRRAARSGFFLERVPLLTLIALIITLLDLSFDWLRYIRFECWLF